MSLDHMNECYCCVHKREVTGSAHIQCSKPSDKVFRDGSAHGKINGWFDYPICFDPTWKGVDRCENFQDKRKAKENPVVSGANMTPDEIGEQLIENTPDAFAAACNQIAALAAANHKLIGSQGALVEVNKHLLSLIDDLRDDLLTYAPMMTVNKLDCIRKFVEVGSKF